MKEEFDFDVNLQKGGIKWLKMDFVFDKQYINERQMPYLAMHSSSIEFNSKLIDISLRSDNLGIQALNFGIKTFKDVIIFALQPFIDGAAFPLACNIALTTILSEEKGEITMGPIQMLLMSLPEHQIVLEKGVTMNYANVHRHECWISNDRMHGYFLGEIDGMGGEEVTDDKYGALGDMDLDDNGPPFEFQISNRLINNMFHVVLAHN